jgi:segregation and condensation protein A
VEEFVVTLEKSEYPIDLLLSLVKEKKLDVKSVSLADMADEFMEFVNSMEFLDLEVMSEFIELASDLIKIKSFSLIPSKRHYARSIENKIKTSLEERERLLQKAKEIVGFVKFMETVKGVDLYEKSKPSAKPVVKDVFYKAFNNAKKRIDFREKLRYISSGKFSISKSIKKLKKILLDIESLEFLDFLDGKEKFEKIAYIVAVLEIVKEDFATIEQDRDRIRIVKN